MTDYGTLTDYTTGEEIRPATREEHARSLAAGETGAFRDEDGRVVYVAGGPEVAASEPEVTTLTAPTDPAAYGRWLAGKIGAFAGRLQSDERVQLTELEAEMLRDAAAALLTALDNAQRQGGIR